MAMYGAKTLQAYTLLLYSHACMKYAYIHVPIYQCFCSSIIQSGVTPLMVASEQGHLPVVKTLLEHNATIDMKDEVWNNNT